MNEPREYGNREKVVTSIIWRIHSLLKGGGCCSDPAMIDIKELK